MRVGIPVSGCDLGESGISRYLIELLRAIAREPGPDEFLLFGSQAALEVFDPKDPRFSRAVLPDRVAEPMPNILWNATSLRSFARKQRLDLLFFPAANRRMPFAPGLPVVGTVHDLSSLHMTGKYPLSHEIYIKGLVPFLIRRLDRIVSVSEATKKDLVETARVEAARITVIAHGVDLSRFSPEGSALAAPAVAATFGIKPPYFLYLARIEHPGKNHVRLIRAFAEYKRRTGLPHSLVLAGKDWDRADQVHREAEASPARADIVFTGFVSNEDVAGLYGGATALVFPSLFEGFGMPLLEAMAAGVPVFCSNTSSLPEVGGDAATYFDPEDEASITRALEATADAGLLAAGRRAGLERARSAGWDRAAAATLAVLRTCAERKEP
ncbi:MAG: glycosyltransferase family 1 protein [Spirochaetota bacterium]